MAQITIDVPNALARRLMPVKHLLPEVLARGLEQSPPLPYEVYRYILEFLASNPSSDAILKFRPTAKMQARISKLLAKNGEGELTPAESTELDEYLHINDLLSLLKTQTLRRVKPAPHGKSSARRLA